MPDLFGYGPIVGVISALAIVQPAKAAERGLHTLPFGGVGVGGGSGQGASDTWGQREGVLFVHSFGSHRDNKIFKTREGVVFLDAPSPKCPAADRTVHALVRLKLDRKSGHVLSVALVQSTGQTILDRPALEALKQWRTRPGVKLESCDIPIVFVGRTR